MIKDLIKVASELDKLGLIKEANIIDLLIKKIASGDEVTFNDTSEMMIGEVSSSISEEEIAERAESINDLPLRFRSSTVQEIEAVRDAQPRTDEAYLRSTYYPGWKDEDFNNLLSKINIPS